MTDNEKLAKWQGLKQKPTYSLAEAIKEIKKKSNYRKINSCDNCENNYPRQVRDSFYKLVIERICTLNKCIIKPNYICDKWNKE